MTRLSKFALTLAAVLLASPAMAQSGCGGQFGAGKFCGNPNSTTGLPGPVALTPDVLAPIAGGTVIGNPTGATADPTATNSPILGIPGSAAGQIGFAGVTSGTVTLKGQAAAGSATVLLPTTSGTLASTAASPLILDPVTGALTCPTCVTSSGGGAITGQTPISVSGAGVVSLDTNGVTYAFFQQVPALSLVGNGTNALANAQSLTGTANQIARVNGAGTAMGFGSIDLSQSAAVGTSILPLANGGTNAALTASNGGLVYSSGSALAILAGTATAGQIPRSGANAAPSWSTATYPATAAAGTILNAGSANVISATATPTLGTNGGTGGQITLNGATSGSAVIRVGAAAGTGTIFQLPPDNGTNGFVLSTNGSGATSWSAAGTGTVTSVSAGTGMSFSTITGSGSVAIDKAAASDAWAATSNKTTTTDILFNAAGALQSPGGCGTATVTPDFNAGFNFACQLVTATNFTLANPTNVKAGQQGCIYFLQPASGTVVTITFGTNWITAGGVTGKALTATLSARDRLCYLAISSTAIDFTLANNITH